MSQESQAETESSVESADPEARIAELEAEVTSLKDKWLRSVADLDNYKKRVRREIDDAVFRARQDLLASFISTADNLERARELARESPQLLKGIEMVLTDFLGALARHGIEPVPSVGVAFDPAIHDALQQIDSPDHAPGTVIREFEKGFRSGERLLRAARVIIASAGSTGGAA